MTYALFCGDWSKGGQIQMLVRFPARPEGWAGFDKLDALRALYRACRDADE